MTVAYSAPLTPGLSDLLQSVPETPPVLADEVRDERGGVGFGGVLAKPVDADPNPAVLVVHVWSGLNDHTRVRAQMLARLGYVAIAADVYGGGQHFGPAEAGPESARYYADPDLLRTRMAANLDRLRAEPGLDQERIAVIGYCFGGSAALEAVRAGEPLAGAVSFHGRLRHARVLRRGPRLIPSRGGGTGRLSRARPAPAAAPPCRAARSSAARAAAACRPRPSG